MPQSEKVDKNLKIHEKMDEKSAKIQQKSQNSQILFFTRTQMFSVRM